MADNNGLYISVDSGGTWLAVVAPSLKYEDPVTRMAGIGSDGPQGLWVSVFDAAMRPCVGRLCRGSAIDVSTDGGRSWTVSRLPGCVDCYPAVSMLGPHDGDSCRSRPWRDMDLRDDGRRPELAPGRDERFP
jgi:hypothetical protein